MSEVDQTLKCRDCRNEFEFTQGEKEFLQRTFGESWKAPSRCKPCRKAKKAAQAYLADDDK